MQSTIHAFLSPQDFGPSSEIIGDLAKQTKSDLTHYLNDVWTSLYNLYIIWVVHTTFFLKLLSSLSATIGGFHRYTPTLQTMANLRHDS